MAHYDNIIQEGKRHQVPCINEGIVYLYVNCKKVKTIIARVHETKVFHETHPCELINPHIIYYYKYR